MSDDSIEKPTYLKRKANPFAQIPNELIGNPNISAKAKAVYCYIASKPDGWKFYHNDIISHMKEGRDSVKLSLSELVKFGFIEKTQLKDENGRFVGLQIEILYTTDKALPVTGKPSTAKPTHSNTNLSNTDKEEKYNKKKSDLLSIEDWESQNGKITSIENQVKIINWCSNKNLDDKKVTMELDNFRARVSSQGKKYANFISAFQVWINSGWLGKPYQHYLQPDLLKGSLLSAPVPRSREMNPTDL